MAAVIQMTVGCCAQAREGAEHVEDYLSTLWVGMYRVRSKDHVGSHATFGTGGYDTIIIQYST